MEHPTGISQELVELIFRHQEKILSSWSEKLVFLSDSQCLSSAEVVDLTKKGLTSLITNLESNSNQAVDAYINELALDCLQADIPIHPMTEALISSKEAILPVIRDAYATDIFKAIEAVSQIDYCIKRMLRQYERVYSETLHDKLIEETQKRITESESLQRTMTALLQKMSLDEMLEIVCEEAQRLIGSSGSAVLLLEDEGWLQVTIGTGSPIPVLDRLPIEGSIAGIAFQSGHPYLSNNPPNQYQAYHRNPDLESLLVIPLSVEGTSIGVLDVVNKPGGFSDDDIRVMSLFADQAAIAILSTRLHQKAEQLAVVEERQRLARELHDSVSQSLYSVILYTDAARLAMSKGESQQLAENLEELHNMAHEAMLDMRLLVFELHPPILEKEGLVAALRTRLESVEARSGIRTDFKTNIEKRLPLSVEAELYRIAQEALTNSVKHAQARNISVYLDFSEEKFKMIIRDDGVGFDPELKDQKGGLGLRGIAERVDRMNGILEIESRFGEGTQLSVEIYT